MKKGMEERKREAEEMMKLLCELKEEDKREVKGIMLGIKMARESEKKTA